jgi:hypothetical protein
MEHDDISAESFAAICLHAERGVEINVQEG